jgi:hypothetical protein
MSENSLADLWKDIVEHDRKIRAVKAAIRKFEATTTFSAMEVADRAFERLIRKQPVEDGDRDALKKDLLELSRDMLRRKYGPEAALSRRKRRFAPFA